MRPVPDPDVPAVDPAEAHEMLEADALLIDVRNRYEWDEARIAAAELKPLPQITEWYETLPRDRPVIVQCQTGVRSEQVVKALTTQAGFTNVMNLTGGIVAWHEAGLPVDRSSR